MRDSRWPEYVTLIGQNARLSLTRMRYLIGQNARLSLISWPGGLSPLRYRFGSGTATPYQVLVALSAFSRWGGGDENYRPRQPLGLHDQLSWKEVDGAPGVRGTWRRDAGGGRKFFFVKAKIRRKYGENTAKIQRIYN